MWIDRRIKPPPTNIRILVWHEGKDHIGVGVVAAHWDYDNWIDVADGCDLNFNYWQFAPPSPYENEQQKKEE